MVSLKPQEIAVVRVRYPGMKEKDFTLFIRDDSVLMHDPVNNFFYPGERVHVEKLRMFTSYFMNIYFEDFVTDPGTRDSVLLSIPDMQVIIDVNDGDPVEFDIFPCYTHGRRDDRYIYIRKNKDPEILIGKHIITDLWGKWKEDFIRN